MAVRAATVRDSASAAAEARPSALAPVEVALAAVALGLLYAALSKLVDVEASFGDSANAILFWPAAGVTVAVFVLRPREEWPAYVVAIVVADAVMNTLAGIGVWTSIGFGVANAIEPVIAALLIARGLGGVPDLSRQRDLAVFLLAAACIAPAASAVLGALWPWALGVAPVWPRLGRWFVGDAVGVLVVAPLIISVVCPPRQALFKISEAWTFAVLAPVLAVAIPWQWSGRLGLPFLVVPVLALIGMRMGTRAAAAGVFVVGVLVESLTALDHGPFAVDGAFGGLLAIQTFLATCAVSALTAAALMTGLVSRDELALHDSLTGLANRRLLVDHLARACRRIARSGNAVGVVYADLDGFKPVNDVHGHQAGDEVLVATGARLASVVRGNDTVARLGGDEFVVLLDDLADEARMTDLMGRMTRAIAEPIVLEDGTTVVVGASLGCAVTRDPDARPEELLERADGAMYAVKRSARGR